MDVVHPPPGPASVHGITSDESSEESSNNAKKSTPQSTMPAHSSDGSSDEPGDAGSTHKERFDSQLLNPRDRRGDIHFVAEFMRALTRGTTKGKASKDAIRQKKERKRQINRASAKRKRVRAKQELEDLVAQCKDLEVSIMQLKHANARLMVIMGEEMKQQSLYLSQIELLKARIHAPTVPSNVAQVPVGGAQWPDNSQSNMLQALISSLDQNSETGRLLQEYMHVERARQALLQQQAPPRQPALYNATTFQPNTDS